MPATTQEFTLHLPLNVVEMLRRATSERHETADQIVAESLWFTLHPVRQDALKRLKGQIQNQQSLSNLDLRSHMGSQLTNTEQSRLSHLIEVNRNEGLTEIEKEEMQQLFDRIEAVATEKAAAIWIMSGRSTTPESVR